MLLLAALGWERDSDETGREGLAGMCPVKPGRDTTTGADGVLVAAQHTGGLKTLVTGKLHAVQKSRYIGLASIFKVADSFVIGWRHDATLMASADIPAEWERRGLVGRSPAKHTCGVGFLLLRVSTLSRGHISGRRRRCH